MGFVDLCVDFDKLHREESGRILATLIRLVGDFDLAEEMLQEAYATALQKWPAEGTPANPRAWLIAPRGTRRSTAYGATGGWRRNPARFSGRRRL